MANSSTLSVAQTSEKLGSLVGTVFSDSAERRVADAQVSFPKLNLTTRTDSLGNFRVTGIPSGSHELIVRNVGYEALSVTMTFRAPEQAEADFVLQPITVKLAPVNVNSVVDARYVSRLIDFEQRRKFSFGKFLTANVFEHDESLSLSRVLLNRLSGISAVGKGTRQTMVSSRNGCALQVVLNGMTQNYGGQAPNDFDINSIITDQVIGLEFYTAATTPAQYSATGTRRGGSQCGTIIIWTK